MNQNLSTQANTVEPILVEVTRGDMVESVHRGSFVVCDDQGHIVCAAGQTDRLAFPRSAIKLLQALPLVASGAAQHWQLTDEELALACASHNGEAGHASTANGVLKKIGLDMSSLECGAHAPYSVDAVAALTVRKEPPCALHNNCSGKHAGFVALGAYRALEALRAASSDDAISPAPDDTLAPALAAAVRGYVKPDHAVMREVTQAIEAATSFDTQGTTRATDGCSIPTYALPLKQMALAYARVATGHGLSPAFADAAARLRRAIAAAPWMTAGTDRFDTVVMTRLGERVCCKVGAEGVYCAALPEQGLGVAIKMDDGNNARAVEVVMAAVIEAFVRLNGEEREFMQRRSHVHLRNWNGIHVGSIVPSAQLRSALAGAKRAQDHAA
jgi:L-asparaginase II